MLALAEAGGHGYRARVYFPKYHVCHSEFGIGRSDHPMAEGRPLKILADVTKFVSCWTSTSLHRSGALGIGNQVSGWAVGGSSGPD
jgi:hypothetical protein